jgi:hypothetical protein
MKNRNRFILFLIAWLMPLAMVAQTNHWTPQSAGYEDNMTLTGVIQINGVEQENTTLEVGAFCGTECRGSARPVLFPTTGRYLVFLTLYGNDGDQITFKLYDHSQGAELNLQSPAAITFGPNGLGSLINPYVLNFTAYNYTITASANPSNGGTISGTGTYPSGSTCTLTATPATGYSFVRWTKNGSQVSTNPSYSFTVTGNASYVAVFSLNSYTISVSANPSAGGTVSGGGTYNYGSSCTLTATPATGYSFVRWTKNGSQVSTNPSYSFTVTGNASYVAVFSLNSYTISASANPAAGGTVSGGGTYNYGSSCTLTATPATGYSFVRWTKNGSQVSTNPSYSFTVTGNASYVAVFSLNSYTISASSSPSAGGSVSGAGSYNYGSTCTLTATPATGYSFVRWTKNGSQVSTNPSYSFTVTGNASYVAVFSLNSYTISVSANPSEGGTVSGGGTYNYGSSCTLTATSATGYSFVNWTENGEVVSTEATYNFTVTGDRYLLANFMQQSPFIPTEDLVAYYPFDGDVNDYSGYGNHGTIIGNVVPATDRHGNPNGAYRFPGDPFNYISVPDVEILHLNSFSLSAWVYSDAEDYGSGYLINKGRDINNGSYRLCVRGIGATTQYGGTNDAGIDENPELGRWHMITGTVEGNQARFYIDGVLKAEETLSNAFSNNNTEPLTFGCHYYNGVPSMWAYTLLGVLDEVRIYNRVLTPQEVMSLYTYEDLVAYYPFNGDTYDYSGNGYHATPYNYYQYENGVASECIAVEGQGYMTSSGGHVLLPQLDLNSLSGITLSLWVKAIGLTSSDGETYINLGDHSNADGVYILQSTDEIQFTYHGSSVSVPYQENYTGNWVMYTLTCGSDEKLRAYVNGTLVGQEDVDYNGQINTSLAALGRHWWYNSGATSTRFNGSFDEVRIYSRALSAKEVNKLYNSDMGCLAGQFSVSETTQVYFSHGNLQYQASTNIWRFAEHQWDCVGVGNANISVTYDGWIDLFGWGTSGYNHGANAYQPYSTSQSNSDYWAYGNSGASLSDQTGQADWGYNVISNGGDQEGQWHTLSHSEWDYLINTRSGTTLNGVENARHVKAMINDVAGLILFPDNYSHPSDVSLPVNINAYASEFADNDYSLEEWGQMETAGAVFLPTAGIRSNGIGGVGTLGIYWSSTPGGSSFAHRFDFTNEYVVAWGQDSRWYGYSVRLVKNVQTATCYIDAVPDPAEGGTVEGVGTYINGSTCTLTATANEGYTFINWTENGEVVSTEATYSFTVMGDRSLVANFVDENACAITFDLYDSYGDGYTSNYLVVNYGDVTEQLTVESGSFASHVLYIPDGSHVELSWIQGNWPEDCSFTISYSNGNWIYHGTNLNNSFSYGFDVDCEGMPVISYSINAFANSSECGTVSLETDFESQQIPSNWTNDATYPWVITTPEYSGYNGSFCMMSGNSGVHSSTSSIEVTVEFIQDGSISFLAGCWGEGNDSYNWDKCRFYIDGLMQMDYGAHQSWENVSYYVTAGNHTFTWTYKKDGSVHPSGDAFFVDDVKFAGASIGSQFVYGQTCTTTASPTEDYQFYCWKENGNVVSTDANYSFTVITDRNLEGVFGPPLSVSVTSNLGIGGMVSGGGVFDYGTTCTVTATPNEGYLFLNWNRNGEVLSCNANYSFTVTEPIALEAVFMPLNGRLIGAGEATNQYLPSYSYYKYTLSQQIYTPDEIGAAGSILTISYFNTGGTKSRSYDIYMVHTDKNAFESETDWITVTEADRVFSGEVTMTRGYWNTILLDVPFDYDGTSNLAIIIDDNSGNYTGSHHMECRVFNTEGNQAIRVYSDNTNYDPMSPPSSYANYNYVALHSVKNQMILGVMPAYHFVTAGTWGNAANWSGGALPGAGDAVFIDANCALNRDAEVAMLSVTPGQVLTLRSGKTLSVTGNLFNTAIEGLVVEDGAQLVNTSFNVAATVKKNVQAYNNSNPDGWYTISSPMNGMVIEGSNFLTSGYDLYRFNETNLTRDEWENYKVNLADFTTFEKGRGYLYANSNTFALAFTGILNNLDVTYTLTCTERPNDPLSGFNLIGNPFPHEIYKGAGGAINNVNLASGYYTLTNEGTWEVHSFDDAIQPGQGFLVKATAPTVLTIAKSNEMAFSESGDAKKGVTERMCISVAGDNGQDRTYVYFGQGVGLDKKNDFDAQVPNLWIRDNGHDYAIAHVEDTDESLELCFNNRQEGDFTLAITTNDMEFEYLQLIDRAAEVTVDLLKQSVYTFHSERNEGTKRFTLAFKKK